MTAYGLFIVLQSLLLLIVTFQCTTALLASNVLLFGTSATVLEASVLAMELLKEPKRLTPSERRRSPRIRLQVPVFLRGADASGGDFLELTKTINISSTGACIACSHAVRIDQVVQLTIPAPSPSASGLVPSETAPLSARVHRFESVGDLHLVGVEFLRPLD